MANNSLKLKKTITINLIPKSLFGWINFLGWISGVVIAKGFWSVFFAITTFGIYSWYLVLEFLIHKYFL